MSRCNYRRVLNISEFQVFQASAYASVPQGSQIAWIWLNDTLWQVSEYVWSTFHRVLNKSPVLNMPRLRIWQGCEYSKGYKGCWICLNKPEHTLIMSQFEWICFDNAKYDWICRLIPEKTECLICQNYFECAWCSTWNKVTEFTERLPRQIYSDTVKHLR